MTAEYLLFLEAVKLDASLQSALKSCSTAEDVSRIAKSAGFNISVDDLRKVEIGIDDSELEDSELEDISGGGFTGCNHKFTHRPTWCP